MIPITDAIGIDEAELDQRFIRAPGPGGQNVNKVASAVQLRFDAAQSPNLPATMVERLRGLAGRRMTADGVLIITANRFRTQAQNRTDALERLIALLRRAAIAPKRRTPTKPSKAARQKRLDTKKRRGNIKRTRARTSIDC
ncbi:MAG TPA: aminoacyl-tRNA hydrolase [Rhodospirillaceae bacterium]|nr:aminoacyl-tRNA hydrolase [Rhodospirillaceae bacterium]HAA93358.1 aminoacyl-tRNA hydrolase [Rhodospirillaceae bacterium]HAT35068.1 aminoacyl-tRNA hydrolase [Rhodospirillaceae bacterium]|tara:strand:+ start:759 stop:1181 length:423 start_codon:yes stop_codon:yes gene_type:complete